MTVETKPLASPIARATPAKKGDGGRAGTRRAALEPSELPFDISSSAWSALVDSLSDAVLVLDAEKRIVSLNGSPSPLPGADRAAVGQLLDRVLGESPEILAAFARSRDQEVEIPGSTRLHVRVTAIGDGQGGATGRLIVVRELTAHQALANERRATAEREAEFDARMRQSTKMEAVGQLAGGVAHDFNNLLTAIRGFAELHLAQHAPDDPGREDVLEIQRAADRAAQLTQGLLAYSRRAEVHPVPLDLAEVVGDAVTLLRRLVGEHVVVRLDANAQVPRVLADRGQIGQVLLNLAANARDAMPGGGVLGVAVKSARLSNGFAQGHPGARAGSYALLEVSDTGSGMDKATQEHLFEPFFTTKPPGEGTGLGLASVYGIVKQANGYIDVESRPGGGSVFRIYLPVLERAVPDVAAKPTVSQNLSRGTETILLVEDDTAVRLFAQRVLEGSGYRVIAFSDPGVALEAVVADPGSFDALVADVVMPIMTGPHLAERIAAIRPRLPTVFMSGYGGDSLPAGVSSSLVKPFGARDLADAVGALFGRPA